MEAKKTPIPKHKAVVILIATKVEQGGDYKVLEINNISNELPHCSQGNKKEKRNQKVTKFKKGSSNAQAWATTSVIRFKAKILSD
jgi:hypothetical protein